MWRRLSGPFREFGFVAGALYAIDRVLRSCSRNCGLEHEDGRKKAQMAQKDVLAFALFAPFCG